MKKSLMLPALAIILAFMTAQSVLACTTGTPGYWKTHGDDWPNPDAVTVGSDDYYLSDSGDVGDLMDILWDRPRGDAWIILAQKVIAAQHVAVSPKHPW